MRSVSMRIGSVGVLMLLAILSTTVAYADEPSPLDPPAIRILPPGGIAAPSDEPTVSDSQAIRVSAPGGTPTPAPELRFFDLFWMWLRVQAKIGPAIS